MATMTLPKTIRRGIAHLRHKDVYEAPPFIVGLAKGLGWFSIALGLTELLAPGLLARITGVRKPRTLQACGVREIATGVGILTSSTPAPWMWGRVAGDAVDLGLITDSYIKADDDERKRTCVSAAAVAGVTALDAICAGKLTASR